MPVTPPGKLRLAAIGHRPAGLATAAMPEIRQALADLLGNLHAHARLAVATNVAEGADRLVMETALALNCTVRAVLPFALEEYERDFQTVESRRVFRSLLSRSDEVRVLDGPAGDRPLAYEAAALALLDGADGLIAVWDGEPGHGRGGTAGTIVAARRRGVPVIHVSATDGSWRLLPGLRPGKSGAGRPSRLAELLGSDPLRPARGEPSDQ